jgi:hypothetical protein
VSRGHDARKDAGVADSWQQRSFFDPLVGAVFAVAAGGVTVPLVLERVTVLPAPQLPERKGAAAYPVRREPFSLLFKGPREYLLSQQIHQMRVAAAPEPLEIFIVPVGQEQDGFLYQAIFN